MPRGRTVTLRILQKRKQVYSQRSGATPRPLIWKVAEHLNAGGNGSRARFEVGEATPAPSGRLAARSLALAQCRCPKTTPV